eukprot:scaffold1234_cov248-Pinguiococcus_pyrenoidosus.AAC.14
MLSGLLPSDPQTIKTQEGLAREGLVHPSLLFRFPGFLLFSDRPKNPKGQMEKRRRPQDANLSSDGGLPSVLLPSCAVDSPCLKAFTNSAG